MTGIEISSFRPFKMPRELHRVMLKHEQSGVYAYEDYTIILIISHYITSPARPWPSLVILKPKDISQVNCLGKQPCSNIVTVDISMPHLQLQGSPRK